MNPVVFLFLAIGDALGARLILGVFSYYLPEFIGQKLGVYRLMMMYNQNFQCSIITSEIWIYILFSYGTLSSVLLLTNSKISFFNPTYLFRLVTLVKTY